MKSILIDELMRRCFPGRSVVAILLFAASLSLAVSGCSEKKEKVTKVTVTHPKIQNITISRSYKGQIQSYRHIKVRALTRGFLEGVSVREGQAVQENELLFQISPEQHQLNLEADRAAVAVAQSQLEAVRKKFEAQAEAETEVLKYEARLARAQAQLAATELNSAAIKAPFAGVIGTLKHQQGSLVEQGEVLTTLSDNSQLWVYFNMPEAHYLEYMSLTEEEKNEVQAELIPSTGDKFSHKGKIGAIQSNFNKQTGSITFRADFANPNEERLHGLSGTVLISELIENALVVPQRSVLEILNKRYVFLLTKDNVARQREIEIEHEVDDVFLVKKGISADDTIIASDVRMLRDGDKVSVQPLEAGNAAQ